MNITKTILLLVFFAAVCAYAEEMKFDNDKIEYDNIDNEAIAAEEKRREETYRKNFEKTMFGVKAGYGICLGEDPPKRYNHYIGGLMIIPLTKIIGSSLLDIEFNYIFGSETTINIPLMFQYAVNPKSDFLFLIEAGGIIDIPIETKVIDTEVALGFEIKLKKVILGSRYSYYRNGASQFSKSNLSVGYLFI